MKQLLLVENRSINGGISGGVDGMVIGDVLNTCNVITATIIAPFCIGGRGITCFVVESNESCPSPLQIESLICLKALFMNQVCQCHERILKDSLAPPQLSGCSVTSLSFCPIHKGMVQSKLAKNHGDWQKCMAN